MNIKLIFILFKKKVISKWSIFKGSILYYPILFSIIVFLVFLVTSRIDEGFAKEFDIDLDYFGSLIFAGSAHAARSILSTIATGWTTILSVAFSVTLITLQLSTTRYTSHLVHKFEEDRINKFTLGWFIATVLYSLLVLKTVRTGEGTADIFAPIIGVNIAIVMASIALFVFVLFLNNISSYLKPKILVLRLVDQIICSIKSYEKRDIDEKSLLHIQVKTTAILKSEQKDAKLFEIKSKEEGILMNINWSKLSSSLKKINHKNIKQSNFMIEFSKSIGESINKGNVLAIVYEVNSSNDSNKNREVTATKEKSSKEENNRNNIFNNNNINNQNFNNNDKKEKNIIDDLEEKILSSIDINKEREISNDPFLGIELLRSLAIKSASNNDIDVTNACMTGLFKILTYIWKNIDIFGLPFTIKVKTRKKKEKEEGVKIGNDENNDDNNEKNYSKNGKKIITDTNNNENRSKKTTITNNTSSSKSRDINNEDNKIITIKIKPKERPLTEVIFSELSILNDNMTKEENIPSIKHFIYEYVTTSKTLLENGKKDEFYLFTDWYSQKLNYSISSLSKEFQNELVSPLLEFQKYLSQNYEYAKNSFNIYMKNIIKI
jgi:uncharacterized membrane protein